MSIFKVEFQNTGMVDGRRNLNAILTKSGLSASFLGEFNDQSKREESFPDALLGVTSARVIQDEENVFFTDNSDMKVSIVITLLVQAEDEEQARALPTPVEMLTSLANTLGAINGELVLTQDECWQVSPGQDTAFETATQLGQST